MDDLPREAGEAWDRDLRGCVVVVSGAHYQEANVYCLIPCSCSGGERPCLGFGGPGRGGELVVILDLAVDAGVRGGVAEVG